MAGDTSESDIAPRVVRETQRFGTIVVVGGGCYGSYYVRQLGRAERAGALAWSSLVVVDRDPACLAARLSPSDRPSALEVRTAEWRSYFGDFLAAAAADPERHANDAIVPSPLMPHLMAEWLVAPAPARRARPGGV